MVVGSGVVTLAELVLFGLRLYNSGCEDSAGCCGRFRIVEYLYFEVVYLAGALVNAGLEEVTMLGAAVVVVIVVVVMVVEGVGCREGGEGRCCG